MILTILFSVVAIIGLVLFFREKDSDIGICMLSLLFGLIGVACCIAAIVSAHVDVDVTLAKQEIEYNTLLREVEAIKANSDAKEDGNIVLYVDVLERVREWNQDTVEMQKHFKSPWLNWFYDKDIVANHHYIEM